jgi:peptidyl-prolyl cis-trans isomerase B (cyclophilin B)
MLGETFMKTCAIGLLTFVAMVLAGMAGCKSKEAAEQVKAPTQAPARVAPTSRGKTVVIVIDTSMGKIKAELWPDVAPRTVENFLRYTDEKFYDGLIFHRVIPGFMIQGGGFTAQMREKDAHAPIANEASADVPNERGTLAMARTNDVDSATAQFFINLSDNRPLNHRDNTPRGFGYCVFGKAIEGMDVVDNIAKARTTSVGPYEDVPVEPILIKSVTRAQQATQPASATAAP